MFMCCFVFLNLSMSKLLSFKRVKPGWRKHRSKLVFIVTYVWSRHLYRLDIHGRQIEILLYHFFVIRLSSLPKFLYIFDESFVWILLETFVFIDTSKYTMLYNLELTYISQTLISTFNYLSVENFLISETNKIILL